MGNSAKIPVLVIGFNRPDLICDRLRELIDIPEISVVVSIDGSTKENFERYSRLKSEFDGLWNKDASISWKFRERNLGLVAHIHTSISEILENHQSIIVIEDDISINKNSISSLEYGIKLMRSDRNVASVGLYSPLLLPEGLLFLNRFRKSKYFACWGWATTKENWAEFNVAINYKDIERMIQKSLTWQSLSSRQKATWIGRFNRVIENPNHTWDTQFQFMSFTQDKVHLLPISSLSKNVGFNDSRAVHTVGRQPNWMRNGALPKKTLQRRSKSRIIRMIMQTIESNTLIGDSALAPRLTKILRKLYQFD